MTTYANQKSIDREDPRNLRNIVKDFLNHNPLAVVGLTISIFTIFLALFGSSIAPYDPIKPVLVEKLHEPSIAHLFGTDDMGRDILSRILAGTKISLGSAAIIISISMVIGIVVGVIAGYVEGWVDDILMRITDIFLAFPALILAMSISATLGPSLNNALIAVSLVWWPWYARLARAQIMNIRKREFVTAAESIGASHARIIFKHLLANAWGPIIVQATLDIGNTILLTASLSFIGLGAQPPTPEWGAMVSVGRVYMLSYWWVPTMPGFAILISVLGFNLLGDAVRDFSDVRGRSY